MKNILAKRRKNQLQADTVVRLGIFVVSFLLVIFIISFEREPLKWTSVFRKDEPSPRNFFAPFSISFINEKATAIQKDLVSKAVSDVYDIDDKLNEKVLSQIDESFNIFKQSKTSPPAGVSSWDNLKLNISASNIRVLLAEDLDALKDWLISTVRSFQERGIMDFSKKMELLNEGRKTIAIRGFSRGEKEREVSLKQMVTTNEVLDEAESLINERFSKNRKLRSALLDLIRDLIKPNLIFNETETQARQKRAHTETPPIFESIKRNEMVAQQGAIVTPDIFKKIQEIEAKRITKQIQLKLLGVGLIVGISFVALTCYLFYFEKKILQSAKKLTLIHSLMIFLLILERFILNIPYGFVHYLLPASVFSLALSLLLNSRMGFVAAFLISVFNALQTNFNTEVYLYSFLGSVIATYTAIGLRKRSEFLKVGLAIGLTNFVAIFGYNVLNEIPLQEAAQLGVFGIMNGILISIPLVFTILPILENIFGLVTDISLLELSDLNHPLLRRMVIEAPGTYHHSLVVSTLAEAACEAIEANGLLARVGGYFHDIGKMEKAEYFTENQFDKEDYHGKLSPSMSYLIIASHVKDGIELAKKHKLKDLIIDFIPQHQGTCPVYYFYKKATSVRGESDEKINIDDYRYPGPKPQTKETAVVLLADSVEAASRSLTNVTPSSIEDLVKDVINWKFIDGQLDECDLTLQDLRKIQESFIHNLIGIFHTRIQYPKSDAEHLWQKITSRNTE